MSDRWRVLMARHRRESENRSLMPGVRPDAWGKPDTQLICGASYEDGEGEICLMPARATKPRDAADPW